ncbi:preprotein translocase subunit SecE [Escherichia coli]|nr:preprotein translocase subunit SecE [Escherichia coli]
MKFFRSVADEMKQVTSPTKKQLRKDTLVVIETSILFAALFFIMDTVIAVSYIHLTLLTILRVLL